MKPIWRFGQYVSVAGVSAASDWLVFFVLVSLLSMPHLPSLMIARVVGGMVSFFINRHWTWSGNRHIAVTQQGRRFLLLYAFSYGSSIILFQVLSGLLGVSVYLAKLITDCGCFVLNFAVMQLYVFSHRNGFFAFAARFRPVNKDDRT